MEDWISYFRKNVLHALKGTATFGARMSEHTTFRIGGPASVFVDVGAADDLALIYEFISRHKDVGWQILGGGSNVLYPERFDGIVVHPGDGLSRIKNEDVFVIAGSGANLMHVIKQAAEWGLGGMEFAAGIPGSIGGAVKGNAGAFGHSISEHVESVRGYDVKEGRAVEISSDDIEWSYRKSGIDNGIFLTEIRMKLDKLPVSECMDEIARVLAQRMEKHPSEPSAGSVFVNPKPPDVTAGRLIEELGFKGRRIGDAMCSPKHANFIVNVGKATQEDVLALINEIKTAVKEHFGIELREEIRIVNATSIGGS